jgi:hypothetical protein
MKTIAEQLNVKDFPFSIKDSNGRIIYYENSEGFWKKREYDSDGNLIYYENSDGEIIDKRPIPETIEVNGVKYKKI